MPGLQIPPSNATVTVKLLHGGTLTAPTAFFWDPVVPGYEKVQGISGYFYVEHEGKGKRLLFDLGLRKDPDGWTPASRGFADLFATKNEKDAVVTLKEAGVTADQIDTVIWRYVRLPPDF
jgi:hypothetical protein